MVAVGPLLLQLALELRAGQAAPVRLAHHRKVAARPVPERLAVAVAAAPPVRAFHRK